jgi:hypothetical protein
MLTLGVRRVVALAVLLAILVSLMIGFGLVTADPTRGQYPGSGQLTVDYDRYVGDTVQVTGTVTGTDPVVLRTDYSLWAGDHYRTGTIRFRVTDLSHSPRAGQTLQVYGTARADNSIQARNTVVVPSGNYLYMYTISALAGVWVLLRLIRGRTIDRATLAIRRRPTPLRYSDIRPSPSEGDTDA